MTGIEEIGVMIMVIPVVTVVVTIIGKGNRKCNTADIKILGCDCCGWNSTTDRMRTASTNTFK